MSIPKTCNPGKIIKFLKKENPSMPQKQRVAIALNTVRRNPACKGKVKTRPKRKK